MSKLRERRTQLKENLSYGNSVWGKFEKEMPELARSLLGSPKLAGHDAEKPCTLMIWADGDKLKWSINCRDERWTAFGCFSDPLPNLEDVEAGLAQGKFELKERR